MLLNCLTITPFRKYATTVQREQVREYFLVFSSGPQEESFLLGSLWTDDREWHDYLL